MIFGWHLLSDEDREEMLSRIHSKTFSGGPFHVEFDWTDRCNVECFFCNNAELNKPGRELSPEIVDQVLDWTTQNGLRSIRLSGGGDPLFHRDIEDLLDIITKYEVPIDQITTNAVLMRESIRKKLLRNNLQSATFSLNYPRAELYAEEMDSNTRSFEKAIENITAMSALVKETDSSELKIAIHFVVYKKTRDDLYRMYEIARDCGVRTIIFSWLSGIDESLYLTEEDFGPIKQAIRQIIIDNKQRIGLDFNLSAYPEIYYYAYETMKEIYPEAEVPIVPKKDYDEYCYIPWFSCAIRGNGVIFPCCMLMQDSSLEDLGNLNNSSFQQLWLGEAFQKYRDEMYRVIMLRAKMNYDKQGFKYLSKYCTCKDGCSIAHDLADESFFKKTDAVNLAKRNSPRGLVTRANYGRLGLKLK